MFGLNLEHHSSLKVRRSEINFIQGGRQGGGKGGSCPPSFWGSLPPIFLLKLFTVLENSFTLLHKKNSPAAATFSEPAIQGTTSIKNDIQLWAISTFVLIFHWNYLNLFRKAQFNVCLDWIELAVLLFLIKFRSLQILKNFPFLAANITGINCVQIIMWVPHTYYHPHIIKGCLSLQGT